MKRGITVAAVITAVAISGAVLLAAAGGKAWMCSKAVSARDPAACESGAKSTAASAKPAGKVLGHFDAAMAGCQFACATRAKYDEESVIAQPGAMEGKLTQCPVSGVIFSVDAKRPHVRVGADDYVTCCGTCAEKLRKNPHQFVRA